MQFGDLEIEAEKTPLAQIIATAGQGQSAHMGDAAGALTWVCYQNTSGNSIWFGSDEIGGGAIDVIALSRPADQCSILPDSINIPITLGGFSLGASVSELKAKIEGLEVLDGWARLWSEKTEMLHQEQFTETRRISAKFEGDRVSTIYFGQWTVN